MRARGTRGARKPRMRFFVAVIATALALQPAYAGSTVGAPREILDGAIDDTPAVPYLTPSSGQ